MKEDFIKQYHIVFNSDGSVKTCGRKECIKLITLAEQIMPDTYGDINTGFMNTVNIQKLYKTVTT